MAKAKKSCAAKGKGLKTKKGKGIFDTVAKAYTAYKGVQYARNGINKIKSGISKAKNIVKNTAPVRAYTKWKTDKDIAKRSEAFINKPIIKELRAVPRIEKERSVLRPFDTNNNLVNETRKIALVDNRDMSKFPKSFSDQANKALMHELNDKLDANRNLKDMSDPYRFNSRYTQRQNWVKTVDHPFEKNDINKSLVDLADKTAPYVRKPIVRPEHQGQSNIWNLWNKPTPVNAGKGRRKRKNKK